MPLCAQCGAKGAVSTPAFPEPRFCRICAMGRVQDPRCPFFPGQAVVIDGLTQRLGIIHYIPATDTIEARTDYADGWVDLTPLRDRVSVS